MRRLPIDYPIRNLARRPVRTVTTALAFALVAGLWMATAAFVDGLGSSLVAQSDDDTAIVLTSAAPDDVLRSTVGAGVASILTADVPGVTVVSPEIHMGTNLRLDEGDDAVVHQVYVRGVTETAYRAHAAVTLVEGRLPGPGEVLVGDLVATRLRVDPRRLAPGERVWFEGAHWPISGVFRAPGTTIAGEIWAPLTALQGAVRRDDVSVLFVRFADADAFADLEVFARRRLDLELVAVPTQRFFAEAAAWFGPIQTLAWALAAMIAAATLFAAVNTFGTAVRERSKELATLRALGFPGRALVVALCVEAFLLAAAGALVGLLLARLAVSGAAFRIAMNAFALDVDGLAVLIGALGAVATGLLATLPAARRILTTPIAAGLKGA